MRDPIVQEVRRARRAHAAEFGFDLAAICADLRRKEKDCGHRVAPLRPGEPQERRWLAPQTRA